MAPPLPTRWVVIGNSGSGKSTLAECLGTALSVPVHDLDLVHWHPDGVKRDEDEARERVAGIAASDAWIIEGVYGWLSQVALARATLLIWLDLPVGGLPGGFARPRPAARHDPGRPEGPAGLGGRISGPDHLVVVHRPPADP